MIYNFRSKGVKGKYTLLYPTVIYYRRYQVGILLKLLVLIIDAKKRNNTVTQGFRYIIIFRSTRPTTRYKN